MKRKLFFTLCFTIIAVSMSAQDTLKVNFKPADTPGNPTWDSILVADKAAFDAGYAIYSIFGGSVLVKPVWLNSPEPANFRAVDRNSTEYTGPLANVLRSYIAVDSRYANDCATIGIEIIGLPAGTYTLTSFHHDFRDQYGKFETKTSVNGSVKDEADAIMISHSIDTVRFNETYPDVKLLDPAVAAEFQANYVTNSLDSISKYTFTQIVSTGTSDVITVSFTNELSPDIDMPHSLKFVLINGFILFETVASSIENKMSLNSLSVYPNPASETLKIDFLSGNVNELSYSVVDITGKTVLMNTSELTNNHLEVDISTLPKGVYLLKVSGEEQLVKKFVIL